MNEAMSAEVRRRRDQVMLAILPHVAFEGWTRRSIVAGLSDAGVSEAEGELLFPKGTADVIEHWQSWSDRQTFDAVAGDVDSALTAADRLHRAVRARIEVNAPYRETVRRTVAFLALPVNAALGARVSWRTVDALWYAAGDTATDLRYYTRRASLATIFAATIFYWLDDDSEEFSDTWAFLERRLADYRSAQQAIEALATFNILRVFKPLDAAVSRLGRQRFEDR